MQWPAEIMSEFAASVTDVTVRDGFTLEEAVQSLLDGAARIAVKRCLAVPQNLIYAYKTPYTPLGEMSMNGFGGTLDRYSFVWTEWSHAIELLDDFVTRNAVAICEEYKS